MYCEIPCLVRRFPVNVFFRNHQPHHFPTRVLRVSMMHAVPFLGLYDGFDEVGEEGGVGGGHWMMFYLRGYGVWALPFAFRFSPCFRGVDGVIMVVMGGGGKGAE